jgi:ribonuclease HI
MGGRSRDVDIYTDGGCVPNPGVGGWAAVLLSGDRRREISGGDSNTTNNRMELTAAIEGLSALRTSCNVVLHTDSEYLRKGITEWLPKWRRNGWKTRTGPVKNADLWERLSEEVERHEVHWKWVKGHSGVEENEHCDELVREAIDAIRHA